MARGKSGSRKRKYRRAPGTFCTKLVRARLPPMRYAWDLRDQYLPADGLGRGWKGKLAHRMLDRLREWDRRTSDRVTHFIASSGFVRERIARCYGRDATVIAPPVDTAFFTPAAEVAAIAATAWGVCSTLKGLMVPLRIRSKKRSSKK